MSNTDKLLGSRAIAGWLTVYGLLELITDLVERQSQWRAFRWR
ncbi:MAG: hypothetical protein WAL04_03940 [Acidimicrobiales bacterium]|jgi:hypothetical protein